MQSGPLATKWVPDINGSDEDEEGEENKKNEEDNKDNKDKEYEMYEDDHGLGAPQSNPSHTPSLQKSAKSLDMDVDLPHSEPSSKSSLSTLKGSVCCSQATTNRGQKWTIDEVESTQDDTHTHRQKKARVSKPSLPAKSLTPNETTSSPFHSLPPLPFILDDSTIEIIPHIPIHQGPVVTIGRCSSTQRCKHWSSHLV
ncbi:hypothetical protein M422DRAFT_272643 [Sphaerobolus stellatus SS14]|uniref:Uncharacterized protein n=1 Tax=Sphaerobolus stellatus (strain SS14) TaxID=990650 RepID=A0A0C9TWT7_SPHS4|nr:hypothetical protein M422DRAFT_272643 [Sphaerobolus stellatus SS14]